MSSKKTMIIFSLLIIVTLITLYINNTYIYSEYKKDLYYNYNNLANNLIELNPSMKNDIIKAIINPKKYSKDFLKEIGLDAKMLDIYKEENNIRNLIYFNDIKIVLIATSIILIIYLYDRYQTKKVVNHIKTYLREINSNNYNIELKEYDDNFISEIKNEIYKVITTLKEQEQYANNSKRDLELLLGDISHQLKTPLTSMSVINDILLNKTKNKKDLELLTENEKQIDRLSWLISSLLKISKLDSGTIKINMTKCNLQDIVLKSIDSVKIPIELKEIKLINKVKKKIVELDFNWTVEAITNIIKNAYEHSNQGGVIKIDSSDNPIYTELSISNTGSVIDETDIKNIFTRFYKSKNSKKDSVGVGLNMAKMIIDLQGGEIIVTSNNVETKFKIRIYKNIK